MEPENIIPIGEEVGHEALGRAAAHGESYCCHERRRIEISNHPKILALHARFACLAEQIEDLKGRICRAVSASDARARRMSVHWYRILAVVLIISGFFFLVISFEPFALGWKAWLYCIGLSILTPFLVELTLEAWEGAAARIWRTLLAVACLSAIGGQLLLAVVRGNIMRQQLANPEPAVVIEDTSLPPAPTPDQFYDQNVIYLQIVMVLFAAAFELGAGIAWREAKRASNFTGEDRQALEKELRATQEQQIECGYAAAVLAVEGEVFEETFRRDFDRAVIKQARNGVLNKLLMISFAAFLALQGDLVHASELNLIVAIDLSASENTKGLDGKTECDRNKSAVSKLLTQVPAGAEVVVVAITDRSFQSPYILLRGRVGTNEGYFNERLSAARRQLVAAWQRSIKDEECRFQQTDVLGSLFVIGELIKTLPTGRTVLVMFSDMKHDMEGQVVGPHDWMDEVHGAASTPLRNVEVHALGVSGWGETLAQWQSLRTFWTRYFRGKGATLRSYSMAREIPELGR